MPQADLLAPVGIRLLVQSQVLLWVVISSLHISLYSSLTLRHYLYVLIVINVVLYSTLQIFNIGMNFSRLLRKSTRRSFNPNQTGA